ncbi:MAG: exodeoxyribonuclease VII small subunit [Ignavibacteria bacterium]|nr:exodeoxyribonuclease VII small subunit [Ignavibacteria bacterium]
MSPKKSDGKQSGGNFERSLKRLEEIIETLERGEVSLDEVMKMYEEGVHLSKACLEQLTQAELKLKRLSKDINGNFRLIDNTEE